MPDEKQTFRRSFAVGLAMRLWARRKGRLLSRHWGGEAHSPIVIAATAVGVVLTGAVIAAIVWDFQSVKQAAEVHVQRTAFAISATVTTKLNDVERTLAEYQAQISLTRTGSDPGSGTSPTLTLPAHVLAVVLVRDGDPATLLVGSLTQGEKLIAKRFADGLSQLQGRVRASGLPKGSPDGVDAPLEMSSLSEGRQGTLRLSGLIPMPIENLAMRESRRLILAARPATTAAGHRHGWMVALIEPTFFSAPFDPLVSSGDLVVQVADRAGEILSRTPNIPQQALETVASSPAAFAELTAGRQGTFWGRDGIDGHRRLFAYVHAPDSSLVIMAGLDSDAVISAWQWRAGGLALFGGLVMIGLLGGSWQLGRYLSAIKVSGKRYSDAKDHLSHAQALAHVGSWQWALDDNQMWWSDELWRICGLPVGCQSPSYDLLLSVVSAVDRAQVAITITQALQSGQSFELTHRLSLPDGSVRHVRQEGQCVLDEFGLVTRLDCVLQDVTEAATLQARLTDASRLTALGEMASGMAHELSQPLNIIRMSVDGVVSDVDALRSLVTEQGNGNGSGRDDPGALDVTPGALVTSFESAITRISGQADRMGQILDHIRLFSSQENGPAEAFDACHAVIRAAEVLVHQFGREGIVLQIDVPGTLSAVVHGYPVQLEQVLVNLLINARDAVCASSPWADEDTAATAANRGWVSLSAQRVGNEVWLTVQDSGNGIPEGLLDRLFDPFFTTKERSGGLGLSVAYGIISAMGGDLRAQNGESGGALFEIRLPIQDTDDEESLVAWDPVEDAGFADLRESLSLNGDSWLSEDDTDGPARVDTDREPPLPPAEPLPSSDRPVIDPSVIGALLLESQYGRLMACRMHLTRLGVRVSLVGSSRDAVDRVRHGDVSILIADDNGGDNPAFGSLVAQVRTVDPVLPILQVRQVGQPDLVSWGQPLEDRLHGPDDSGVWTLDAARGALDVHEALCEIVCSSRWQVA